MNARPSGIRYTAGIIVVVAAIAAIYYLYYASYLGAVTQWVGALVALLLSGMAMKALFRLKGGYGVYMLSSSRGIKTIKHIADSHQKFWHSMALWGIVLGFGILAYPLLKGRISKRLFAAGLISLALIMLFALPFLSYAVIFINIAPLSRLMPAVQGLPSPLQFVNSALSGDILTYALRGATLVAGFTGYMFYLLAINTYSILQSVGASISTSSLAPLSSQVPGVAPLIPGVDTPLFAGIIALVIILMVHELSHGVLASMLKVRLKSVGLLVLGIIPIGAFVEPDEKKVEKLPMIDQDKILAAGVSANFILMLVALIPMVVMVPYVVQHIYQQSVVITATMPGYPAYNVITPGSQLVSWDGRQVGNLTNFESFASNETPGSVVKIVTSAGAYSLVAQRYDNSSRGLIGIEVAARSVALTPTLADKAVYFLYTLFALLFMLNFLVAVVNFLPLPGLDGWRIYTANIKSKRFVQALTALVVFFLLVNILPWA